jgi:hypothetical protein
MAGLFQARSFGTGLLTIGDSVFANNVLTNLTIPDNVTYIGDSAFDGNLLTSVVIGNGVVYIGPSAFTCYGDYSNDNRITSVTLGNSIKYIGRNAFYRHRISTLVIPEGVVYISSGAFLPQNQNSLTAITIGDYMVFPDDAFSNAGNFSPFYKDTNYRKGGSYTFADGNWSYTPR